MSRLACCIDSVSVGQYCLCVCHLALKSHSAIISCSQPNASSEAGKSNLTLFLLALGATMKDQVIAIREACVHCVCERHRAGECRSNKDMPNKLSVGAPQFCSSPYRHVLADMLHAANKTLQHTSNNTCYCAIIEDTCVLET